VHTPTGDELNLLGSGTWGTRPFVAVSHSGRIAPHASFGYQINGNSVLAGDITKNTKAHLPNVVTYDAGADFGVTRRIGVSADFIALALLNETKITQGLSRILAEVLTRTSLNQKKRRVTRAASPSEAKSNRSAGC